MYPVLLSRAWGRSWIGGRRICLGTLTVQWDVEVAQGEAHDILEGRSGDDLAEKILLRLVYQYQGEVFGVSGGGEAYKRGNVLVAVESRLGVDLLRGPGFAGHRVPGDLGKMSRPFVDHALEHPRTIDEVSLLSTRGPGVS